MDCSCRNLLDSDKFRQFQWFLPGNPDPPMLASFFMPLMTVYFLPNFRFSIATVIFCCSRAMASQTHRSSGSPHWLHTPTMFIDAAPLVHSVKSGCEQYFSWFFLLYQNWYCRFLLLLRSLILIVPF